MGWEAEGGGGGQREGGAGREAAEGGGLWGNAYKQLHMGGKQGGIMGEGRRRGVRGWGWGGDRVWGCAYITTT